MSQPYQEYDIENLPTDKPPEIILDIELVPATSFWDNVRSMVPKKQWDKIRRECYEAYDYKCAVCKRASKRLNCHEIWHYFDSKHIQTLAGFVALCNMCHHVKHIGLAELLAFNGKFRYQALVAHFMKINKCTEKEFWKYREEAFELWDKRSKHNWTVRLGDYDYLLEIMDKEEKKYENRDEKYRRNNRILR